MGYKLHEEFTSQNQCAGGQANSVWGQGNRQVQGIVIHHWGARGQKFWDVVNYLCTNSKPTSAHFVAQDGLVACIVSPTECSYHAGHGWANSHTVGIECRPEATDGDKRTVAELIAKIRQDYNDPNLPLTPHSKWQATECPGVYDLNELDRMARAIWNGGAPVAAPAPINVTPASTPTKGDAGYVPDPHWVIEKGETLGQVARHYGLNVAELAKYNGIKNPDVVHVGERVWPCSGQDTWTVDPGDTLNKVADFYGITVDAICYVNGINDPNKLPVGLRLNIPR